jgi:hypothetical protein
MSAVIKLSEQLINDAKRSANFYHRSIPKQIEYWSQIGKIVEENPDLTYNFIKDILLAKSEVEAGEVEAYTFETQ